MNAKIEQQIIKLLHQLDDTELNQVLNYLQKKQNTATLQNNLIDLLGTPNGVADIEIEFPRSPEIARPVNLL